MCVCMLVLFFANRSSKLCLDVTADTMTKMITATTSVEGAEGAGIA